MVRTPHVREAARAARARARAAALLNQRLESTLATLKALDELANAEVPNNAEIRDSLDILTSNLDHLQRAKDAHDVQLPRELVQHFVDEGKNPDLWAQTLATRCESSRRLLDGKSSALHNLGKELQERVKAEQSKT